MVYLTGDIHGNPEKILKFVGKNNCTEDDIIIILGDAGFNYFKNRRDIATKQIISTIKPVLFCIHGNHEIRPYKIPTYTEKQFNGGTVWYEKDYPRLLFAKDGEVFDFEGKRAIVIGGAYSVDKYYRLSMGYGWWPDEQPSKKIKDYVEKQLSKNNVDIVLSHTCPYKFIPRDTFLTGIDQSTVDDSTEKWLDKIEESIDYCAWYCGHWHIDRHVEKLHFLMNSFECL